MTFVVLFLLALLWAVYLASWFRGRSERPVNSISSFNKHLSVLERTSPARHGLPAVQPRGSRATVTPLHGTGPLLVRRSVMTISEARRRRRDVLFALAGAALVTLLLAIVAGGIFLWLQVLADLLLVVYAGLLVRTQQLASERRAKVRYLSGPVAVPAEPAYYLPRSASAN
ncbi:MAG: hypothetical protein WHS89_11435 [Acidimicrobiales bacterium]